MVPTWSMVGSMLVNRLRSICRASSGSPWTRAMSEVLGIVALVGTAASAARNRAYLKSLGVLGGGRPGLSGPAHVADQMCASLEPPCHVAPAD